MNNVVTTPNGMGAVLMQSPTSNTLLDVILGAGVGYFASPKADDRPLFALAGATAAWALGALGVIGVVGYGVYLRSK